MKDIGIDILQKLVADILEEGDKILRNGKVVTKEERVIRMIMNL